MSLKTYLVNTRQKAIEAQRRSEQDTSRDKSGDLIKAVVLAVNGAGFDIQTVDASGNAARIYQRVYPWPSDASLSPGDEVWVRLSLDGETAEIVVSGGSGASCFQSYTEWGAHFG